MNIHKKIIKNKFVTIKPFADEYINKEFVKCINKKSINKYLNIRHKKQTIKTCIDYLNVLKNNGDLYYAIFSNSQKKLIGTLTLRSYKKKYAFLGYMICYKKYFGSIESKKSFQIFLKYIFDNSKITKIYAGTEKENIASNFNLIANNFKLIKKTNKFFWFVLNKKDFIEK